MIPVPELCTQRQIKKVDLYTPLLIPSFSSKGFANLGEIVSSLDPFIIDTAMVSSYDIFHGFVSNNALSPNLLFIDSGGYEARQDFDLAEVYALEYQPRVWNRKNHIQVLRKLDTLSAVAAVSFDEVEGHYSIGEQVRRARSLFDDFPHFVSDFLIKPDQNTYVNVDEVVKHCTEVGTFDIVGFTEKELGPSPVERLKNVIRIRQAFNEADVTAPIHVFGCLDPLMVQLFYLCGADVFDGLSWLRFGYHESLAIYLNNWIVLADKITLSDAEARQWTQFKNLEYLNHLRDRMIKYASSFDLKDLTIAPELVQQVLTGVRID